MTWHCPGKVVVPAPDGDNWAALKATHEAGFWWNVPRPGMWWFRHSSPTGRCLRGNVFTVGKFSAARNIMRHSVGGGKIA